MNCPKCGHEQPDGLADCGKCGVIFAKLNNAAARPRPPAPFQSAAPRPSSAPQVADPGPAAGADEEEKKPAPLWTIMLLLLALGAAAWWLNVSSGDPVPEGAYRNDKNRFALQQPPDWIMLTPENFKSMVGQYKDRIPKELRPIILNSAIEVSFFKIVPEGTVFSPSMNVVVFPVKQNLTHMRESDKAEAVEQVTKAMKEHLETYLLQSAEIVEIDKVRSLRITATASLKVVTEPSKPIMSPPGAFGLTHVVGHTPEAAREVELMTEQYFIPSRGKAFIITCTHESALYNDEAGTFKAMLGSFRVLDRPTRFGPVVMGALNGGMVGAGLYLVYLLLGRLFKVSRDS